MSSLITGAILIAGRVFVFLVSNVIWIKAGRYNLEMALALSIFGVAFAAFCVWLAVRIVNRRERWAKWTAAGISAPVLYVLSAGPAIWIVRLDILPEWAIGLLANFYHPLMLYVYVAPSASLPIIWYLKLFGYIDP